MVPEIIVPDLTDFQVSLKQNKFQILCLKKRLFCLLFKLKPYVSYNSKEETTPVFDAKQLYESTLEKEVLIKLKENTNQSAKTE
jgi:hypothetical protein